MPHLENQVVQQPIGAKELQRAEEHEVFQYQEDFLPLQSSDPLQRSNRKEADKLKKKQVSGRKRVLSLERKLRKEKGEEERWKLELQIKKEKLKLGILAFQEQQKRMAVLPDRQAMKSKARVKGLQAILELRTDLVNHFAAYGALSEEQEQEVLAQQEHLREEAARLEELNRVYQAQVRLVAANTRAKQTLDSTRKSILIQQFRELHLTEEDLEEETIRANPEEALRRFHLIRTMKGITNYRKYEVSPEEEETLRRKIIDLQDYQSFVREVFRKEGIDIFHWHLRYAHTADQMGKRVAFLAGKQQLLKKFYRNRSWNLDAVDEEARQRKQEAEKEEEKQESILERKLSLLEAELEIQKDPASRIARTIRRPVKEELQEDHGKIIKADLLDTIGSMNRFYEKSRLERILHAIKKRIEKPKGGQPHPLEKLEQLMLEYGRLLIKPGESRSQFEKKEGKALKALMEELTRMTEQAVGETKRYLHMLSSLMSDNIDGRLEVPEDGDIQVIEDARFDLGFNIAYPEKWKDRRNDPLFPHAPCIKDIKQGGVGDCYLMAGLLSILSIRPEAIRECIKDNGDGTVTVRFFRWNNVGRKMLPEYYTITKTSVQDGYSGEDVYAKGSLWVQMIEKAFAASGLPKDTKGIKKDRVEKNVIRYQDIRSGDSKIVIWELLGLKAEQKAENRWDEDTEQQIKQERERMKREGSAELYTTQENAIFEELCQKLDQDNYVTFSAKSKFKGFFLGGGLNGEQVKKGVAAKHAYGILGTKVRTIAGKQHKYVMIANPWGNTGRIYQTQKGKDFGKAKGVKKEAEEGVLLLDLKDFIELGSSFAYMK